MKLNWKIAYAPNCKCKDMTLTSISDIESSGFDIIDAEVPGNFELDLMRAGKIDDLYYSVNTLQAQKLENMHVWYYTAFNIEDKNTYIHFDGIDTISDIYVNGRLVKSTDNMFIGYDISDCFTPGINEMVVHIKPVCIEARKYSSPVSCMTLPNDDASLYIRKAAHMFGWDIMPRIVSAGIWKDVSLEKKKEDKITEVYFAAHSIDFDKEIAHMHFHMSIDVSGDCISDYSVRIKGKCGVSEFTVSHKLWHNSCQFWFDIENCLLWWPKGVGAQNLYDTEVELLYKGKVCDTMALKVGVRTVKLDISDSSKDKVGDFCFEINGKKIFVLGTNWVPLDAFHSQDSKRLYKALELLEDIGCNAVRCWGGNVYESDEFFDYCDEHGIMVWQDFSMACAVYPQDADFQRRMEEEAVYQIKRLRNHSSLVLWAGDNECDQVYSDWLGEKHNPNNNIITRTTLKNAVELHDYSRPYLPSSPYISDSSFNSKLPLPENHLWGPRDYFKGEYYKNSVCRFASETGYHGFPSPDSLSRFLAEPEKIFKEDFIPTDEYLIHATCTEASLDSPSAYRIKLAYDQVVTLFTKAEESLSDFVKQSQISQAEAKKYFIERFRLRKWERTGIIWWNLLDGWPQVSDAVVDYYFTKKLAYHYIKRSQNPVCFMFDEPSNNIILLYAVNDLPYDADAEYSVINLSADKLVLSGNIHIPADMSVKADELTINDGEKSFYLIEWKIDGKVYKNHYFTNIIDIDYKEYLSQIQKCGFDEFEGF